MASHDTIAYMITSLNLIPTKRRVDPIGRIVIPSEIRNALAIQERSQLDFYMLGEWLVMQKEKIKLPEYHCVVCGRTTLLKPISKGNHICKFCIEEIMNLALKEY